MLVRNLKDIETIYGDYDITNTFVIGETVYNEAANRIILRGNSFALIHLVNKEDALYLCGFTTAIVFGIGTVTIHDYANAFVYDSINVELRTEKYPYNKNTAGVVAHDITTIKKIMHNNYLKIKLNDKAQLVDLTT